MLGRSRQGVDVPMTQQRAPIVEWFVRRGVPSLLRGTGMRPDTGAAMVRPLIVVYVLAFAWYSVDSPSGRSSTSPLRWSRSAR